MNNQLRTQLETSLGQSYAIERELTGGGMSRVYVATERALGRRVVIKVLSPELAAEVSAKRFAREIRVVASLQQANIVPVLAAGETEGVPYYTMPFVEGLSLRERLERDGRLPLGDTISILRDVARALAYAHEHGVVHRDIKPGNVLLSGDAAVVTDFGLAKALSASRLAESEAPKGESTFTVMGAAIGTPAYMAPEQITADPSVDHRADLYSFGCLAYELLAGEPPFGVAPPHALLAAHLGDTPAPIGERNPETPPALSRVVTQCLAKDPVARPNSAREILRALDGVTAPATGLAKLRQRLSRRQRLATLAACTVVVAGTAVVLVRSRLRPARSAVSSVAVIPFLNASRDSADEYLVDGMADGLATALGKIAGIRVVARTLSSQFRGRRVLDPGEVRRALSADYVVQGSVQHAAGRIILSAQLTSTRDSVEVWSDSYDRPDADAQTISVDITRAIAAKLGVGAGVRTASSTETASPEAYDVYLRGRFLLQRRGGGVRQAAGNFERAIARDSGFARAHAALAFALELLPYFEAVNADSLGQRAVASATRALARDSTLADAHLALALAHQHRYQWREAEASYRRALAAGPDDADVHIQYGRFLFYTGKMREALPEFEHARDLDPNSAVASGWVGHLLELSGRDSAAMVQLRRALEMDSTLPPALVMMAQAHLQAGRRQEARVYADRLTRVWPGWRGSVAVILAQLGDREGALAALREIQTKGRIVQTPGVYAALGDSTGLFETLERMTAEREIWPTYASLSERGYDFVRRSARFAAIVRSVGLDERIFTSPTGGRTQ